MTIATRFYTWLKGELVGSDAYGNRYFRERSGRKRGSGILPASMRHERRWVLYDGEAEASKVPPEWHAWLHHTIEQAPTGARPQRPWQKPHVPNMTGTAEAYRPPGHDFEGGRRAKATGDYEPWKPS